MCGLVEKLHAQLGLGIGGLGHDEQSAGIFVYAVHQSHLRVVGVVCRQVAQVPGNGIDQRAVIVAAPWVHHHARRLVDHHQFIVFIHDVERDIFGVYAIVVVRTVEHQRDHIPRPHLVAALHRTVVHMHKARIRCTLNTVATGVLQFFHQKLVDAQRHQPLVGHKAQMLVQLLLLIIQFGDILYLLFCHYRYI